MFSDLDFYLIRTEISIMYPRNCGKLPSSSVKDYYIAYYKILTNGCNVSCSSFHRDVAMLPSNKGMKAMKTNVVSPEIVRQRNREFGRSGFRKYEQYLIKQSKV